MSSADAPDRIFLCHCSVDKAQVQDLYQRLRKDGFNPWLDEEDLVPGQEWDVEIRNAVRSSAVIIVCLSKASISRAGYIQKEMRLALEIADQQPEGQIFIIPVRLEECDLPQSLRRWHAVDLRSHAGYDRLAKALQTRFAVGMTSTTSTTSISTDIRATVHAAYFMGHWRRAFFVNITNITHDRNFEVTHVWFASDPEVHVSQPDRPLPKRLVPQESWETWVYADLLPDIPDEIVMTLARVRLSSGRIIRSVPNIDVPSQGRVPGGPITRI